MGLLSRGMGMLARVGAETNSVSVTYSRPGVFSGKTVGAVIGGPGFGQEDIADVPGRIGEHAVDFIVRVADWITAGCLGTPGDGDLVVWSSTIANLTANRKFRVFAGNNVPAWDWGEPERVTYRIHARAE